MNRRTFGALLLLVVPVTGCDKVQPLLNKLPFIGKKEAAPPPGTPAAQQPDPAVDTAPPSPPPPATPAPVRPAADEPWNPIDTGTVTPGMSREEVVATWGVPVAERQERNWTYLYFRNGCEVSCGTFDVVFLENGQVVDAVVRGPGHSYAGTSTSPSGRPPEATPPATAAPLPPAPSQD